MVIHKLTIGGGPDITPAALSALGMEWRLEGIEKPLKGKSIDYPNKLLLLSGNGRGVIIRV